MPEVVSLVLKPKGNLAVAGSADRTSSRGQTRIAGTWPVVRLWELDAEALLAAGDVGLIPWVPLAKTTLTPDELLTRCRDRLVTVPDPNDRAGLIAVTYILAGLAFPGQRFLHLFGGAKVMIDSPVLDEVKELIRVRNTQELVAAVLDARFGAVPADRIAALNSVTDETRLKALLRLAATCPDLDAFVAGLTAGT